MAQPAFSNVIDHEVIERAIGDKWLYDSRIVQTNAIDIDSRPIPRGTQTYYARERDLQDLEPEAVAAAGTISPNVVVRTKVAHPRVWRYANLTYSDVLDQIDDLEYEDAATKLRRKAVQDLDNDIVAVIKGITEAITGTQFDGSSAVIDLDDIVDTMATLGDRGLDIMGGIAAGRSELYFKLVKLGLVAQSSNTFGNANQELMVRNGVLPMNLLGLTYIMSNKFAALGGNQYYLHMVAPRVIGVRGAGQPTIETARLGAARQMGTAVNLMHGYGVGIYGVNWKGSASEVITTTDLGTAANWELKTQSANMTGVARLKTKTA